MLGNLRFELVVLILDSINNSLPTTDTPQPRESLDATNFGYEYKYSLALTEQHVFLCLITNNWISYQINLNIWDFVNPQKNLQYKISKTIQCICQSVFGGIPMDYFNLVNSGATTSVIGFIKALISSSDESRLESSSCFNYLWFYILKYLNQDFTILN